MISGTVTELLDAIISLSVRGENSEPQPVAAAIDTGFSGELTLPPSVIDSLGLTWLCRQDGMLADGQVHTFDVYVAIVLWGDAERLVEVDRPRSSHSSGCR